MGVRQVTLNEEVKYMRVILDNKLLWQIHLEEKCQKAKVTFCQCKWPMESNWNLDKADNVDTQDYHIC